MAIFQITSFPNNQDISSHNEQIFLITEYIQKGKSSKNFWQTFAHQLAALHKHFQDQFGLSTIIIGSLRNKIITVIAGPNFMQRSA
jgi:fructosamine-3-kinase